MKDNYSEWIREKQVELETRDKILRERERALGLIISEQNERLEKLRKGYIVLGLIKDDQQEDYIPVTGDKFLIESALLAKSCKIINGQFQTKEEIYKSQNLIEQYIADMMTLIGKRWNTVCAFKDLYRIERTKLKQDEINLLNDYSELGISEDIKDQSKWIESVDELFQKHKQLFEEQEKRLFYEEQEQVDLESLFDMRERLFKMAETSFLI